MLKYNKNLLLLTITLIFTGCSLFDYFSENDDEDIIPEVVETTTEDDQDETTSDTLTPTSITIDNTQTTLEVGEELTLTYTVAPEGATYTDLVWTTSDDTILSVNSDGVVTGVSKGEAIITVTISETEISNTLSLEITETVTPVQPRKIYDYITGDLQPNYPNSLPDINEYRPLENSELYPENNPAIGDIIFVNETTERKAVSENNYNLDDWSMWGVLGKDLNKLYQGLSEHIKNGSNLNNTNYTHPSNELTYSSYNNTLIEDYNIYIYLKSIDEIYNGFTTFKELFVNYRITEDNRVIIKKYYNKYSSEYSLTEPYFIICEVIDVDLNTGNSRANYRDSYKNYDSDNSVDEGFYRQELKNTSNSKIEMMWGEDSDQILSILTDNGKVMIFAYDGGVSSHIRTDFWNSSNELLAIAPDQYNTEDVSYLSTNALGDYIQTSPLHYSLKRALPLKDVYSNDYDIINIVYNNGSTWNPQSSMNYYLYKKSIDGNPRAPFPVYIPGATDYIDNIIDPDNDIPLFSDVELLYDYDGYFTWIRDIEYFKGTSISTVETLKGEFKELYDEYWLTFRNRESDYSNTYLTAEEELKFSTISN